MLFIRLKNRYFTQFLYTTFYLTYIYNLEYDLLMDKKNNNGGRMKTKIPTDEYKVLLKKIIKAYHSLEEVRVCMIDFEDMYCDLPSFLNSEHIDECQSTLEKQLGWDLLNNPKHLGFPNLKKKNGTLEENDSINNKMQS